MIFKNPLALYGLLFLIVPIIVHLFQLRRFTKVYFTNVAFLKPLIQQSRKSRSIKKWLTLLIRMATITALVIAFAQPYIPASDFAMQDKETVIYLDNSYSMQVKGEHGVLYTNAVNDLISYLPNDQSIHLFTNDMTYQNVSKQEVVNDLLQSDYSDLSLSYQQVQLKAQALFSQDDKRKEFIVISDFQKNNLKFPDTISDIKRELVYLKPQEQLVNIAIDTAYITTIDASQIAINVQLSSNTAIEQPVTISLENNKIVIAKTSVDLSQKKQKVVFNYNKGEPLHGRIYINDNALSFDNQLYINYNQQPKIKVLAINQTDSDYLKRIFTADEFDLLNVNAGDVNYNLIKNQDLIILNELTQIPPSLAQEINKFKSNNGSLLIIPSLQTQGYNSIYNIKPIPTTQQQSERRVTSINFDHPLLSGVFNKKITNFQYPKINKRSQITTSGSGILSYDDGSHFLYNNANTYIFTAPLNESNSNFIDSPLIVPVLYNIGKNSLPLPQLYYNTNQDQTIAILTQVTNDNILQLYNTSKSFIPLQRAYDSQVVLDLNQYSLTPGNYQVMNNDSIVSNLSFNSTRTENNLNYYTQTELQPNRIHHTISDLQKQISNETQITQFWKYFIGLTILLLIAEILVLKYMK